MNSHFLQSLRLPKRGRFAKVSELIWDIDYKKDR